MDDPIKNKVNKKAFDSEEMIERLKVDLETKMDILKEDVKNEINKKDISVGSFTFSYTKLAIFIIILCVVGYICWFLFRPIHSDGGAADGVRESISNVEAEQRNAAAAIERLQQQLDDSKRDIERLRESNSLAQERVEQIETNNYIIREQIQYSQDRIGRSNEILEDSQRRIEESSRLLRSIREGASKS